jgi:hypothetical protein
MAKMSSPSDYTAIAPNYSTGQGYYTNSDLVADLLQIPQFTGSTNPTEGQVGAYIKRVEDYIDVKTGLSYRPIFYNDEVHNFLFTGVQYQVPRYWSDYVGFIQLNRQYIHKIIRLEVWQGNSWIDLASATANITVSSTNKGVTSTITLGLPNSTNIVLNSGTTANQFDNTFGSKTTAQEISYLINEIFPTNTSTVTGATAAKSDSDNPSNYFYATVDSEDQTKVIISSLLTGEDGTGCTIATTGTGLTETAFTDKENMKRLGAWWKIDREGRIFFRTKFPYLEKNTVRVTYIAGNHRVPGTITDVATKLTACEILRHDDQTVLIAETGAQIDIKTKYDLLKQESEEILKMQKETIFLIE